jgi:predicted DNA-binding transcriptional regulator AlpA
MTERALYSTKEVAREICRSVPTIKRWKREGKFPQAAINEGRTVLWTREQLEDWINQKSNRKEVA